MFEKLFTRLCLEISGVRAKRFVSQIARFHRIQASPGYDDALRFVETALGEMGVATRVSEFPADGRTETFGWRAPHGWGIRSGSLQQISPKTRLLGLYEEIPQAVLGQCPGGSAEGEIVHIGEGANVEDLETLDLEGRFVLTTGRPMRVIRKLKGRGIAGLILYPTAERAAPDYDLVQYAGLFPNAEEIDDLPLGFSISRRAADGLLGQLQKEPVTVRGEVDAQFLDHPMRVLEGWIPGTDADADEVLVVAHLCHPAQSANDNASGSGLLLEVARTLAALAEETPLRHTIRFLWVPEFNGTIPWAAANQELLGRTRFTLNLDMVGQSPEIIGEPLRVFRTPNARASFLDSCFGPILARIAASSASLSPQGSRRPLHYLIDAPSGGSDHLVFNAAPFELPSPMLGHDDPYWHTDLDTLNKVDPTRLKQVGILTSLLVGLPTWATEEGERLRDWLLAFSAAELARASRLARDLPGGAGAQLMRIAHRIEEQRWESLAAIAEIDDRVDAHREALVALLASFGPQSAASQKIPSGEMPRCVADGPVSFMAFDDLGAEEQAFLRESVAGNHGAAVHSLVGLCDGTRTIEDIALQMTLEFDKPFAVEDARRAFELLERAGYIKL